MRNRATKFNVILAAMWVACIAVAAISVINAMREII